MKLYPPNNGTRHGGRDGTDPDAWQQLIGGLTVSQVCSLLRIGRDTANRGLRGIKPSGVRSGANTFFLADVMSAFLVPSDDAILDFLRRAKPADLPGKLSVALRRAELLQMEVDARRGHTWAHADLVQALGRLFGDLAMQLRLAADRVERRGEMTDRQRAAMAEEIKALHHSLAAAIKDLGDQRVIPDDDDEI